jgi:hypothetical protein
MRFDEHTLGGRATTNAESRVICPPRAKPHGQGAGWRELIQDSLGFILGPKRRW